MPIYEYRCSACAFQKEYLQKVSDTPLSVCPQCGQPTFTKMLSAAGFQLKGTGWYVTDFRNGSGKSGKSAEKGGEEPSSADAGASSGESAPAAGDAKPASGATPSVAKSDASPGPKPDAKPAAKPGTKPDTTPQAKPATEAKSKSDSKGTPSV